MKTLRKFCSNQLNYVSLQFLIDFVKSQHIFFMQYYFLQRYSTDQTHPNTKVNPN